MRNARNYDGICQCEEIGTLECTCQDCVSLRLCQVESFIEADRMRRQLWPMATFDAQGNVVVTSREETVRCQMMVWP